MKVEMVVAKFAPAAINSVLLTISNALYEMSSTIPIVKTAFDICSILCECAVGFIFSLALKNPLSTEIIDSKNIDGASTSRVISASGICKRF